MFGQCKAPVGHGRGIEKALFLDLRTRAFRQARSKRDGTLTKVLDCSRRRQKKGQAGETSLGGSFLAWVAWRHLSLGLKKKTQGFLRSMCCFLHSGHGTTLAPCPARGERTVALPSGRDAGVPTGGHHWLLCLCRRCRCLLSCRARSRRNSGAARASTQSTWRTS